MLDHFDRPGLALVGDRADDVIAGGDGDRQRARVVGVGVGDDRSGAVVGLADDRLLVVGEVGRSAGRLADGVVAGGERLLAGRAAVTDVLGVGVGGAVDLEVELAAIGRGLELLDDLDLAGLALV